MNHSTFQCNPFFFFLCLCDFLPFSFSLFSGKVKPLFIYLLARNVLCVFMTGSPHAHCLQKQEDLFHFFASWVTEIQREDETKGILLEENIGQCSRQTHVEHVPAGDDMISGTDELSRCRSLPQRSLQSKIPPRKAVIASHELTLI